MKNICKRLVAAALCAVMIFAMAACEKSTDPDEQVAKVNDTVITRGELDGFSKLYAYMMGYDASTLSTDDMENILENMVDTEVIRQYYEAQSESIYDDDYETNLATFIAGAKESEEQFISQNDITDEDLTNFYRTQYITQKFFEEIQAEKAEEDMYQQASDYYDEHKEDYAVDDELRASVILVETEDEAKDIVKQLDAGADFATLAKEKSIEENSAANGGDMGYFTEDQMASEYSDKVFALEVGEYTDPMETSDGYAIMKITDKNDTGYKSLDEVLQDIYYIFYDEIYDDKIDELEEGMTIEISEL